MIRCLSLLDFARIAGKSNARHQGTLTAVEKKLLCDDAKKNTRTQGLCADERQLNRRGKRAALNEQRGGKKGASAMEGTAVGNGISRMRARSYSFALSSSSFAIFSLCTSSGPSANRSVRAPAHIHGKVVS